MVEAPVGHGRISQAESVQALEETSLSFLDRETDTERKSPKVDTKCENGTRGPGWVKREYLAKNSCGRTEQTFPPTLAAATSVYLLAFTSSPNVEQNKGLVVSLFTAVSRYH